MGYTCLFQFWFPWCVCPAVGLLGHKAESESESEVAQSCPILTTPWTVACQAPLSMGFSKQEYGIGLPFPSPGNLPNPEIKPGSPALQADSLQTELPGKYFRLN